MSFAIVILNKYFTSQFSNAYTHIDCGGIEITKADAYNDYMLGDDAAGLIGCYCFD